MATTHASAYRAYYSKPSKTADVSTWVQVDLGESRRTDFVKVYPANDRSTPGEGFPVRFKIEASNDPEFHHAAMIVDHTGADYPNPQGRIEQYDAQGGSKPPPSGPSTLFTVPR
jgi:uncharacterized protein